VRFVVEIVPIASESSKTLWIAQWCAREPASLTKRLSSLTPECLVEGLSTFDKSGVYV
jgi:hypothetical protein